MIEFWEITPAELGIIAQEYAERQKRHEKLLIAQAYLISRWVWTKRLNINKILDEEKTASKKMTDEDMLREVKRINAMLGGEVR